MRWFWGYMVVAFSAIAAAYQVREVVATTLTAHGVRALSLTFFAVAVVRYGRATLGPWLRIGYAQVCFALAALGEVLPQGVRPLADLCYVGAFAFMAVGAMEFGRSQSRSHGTGTALDSAIVVVAVGLGTWQLVLSDVLSDSAGRETDYALAGPIVTAFMLVLAARVLLLGAHRLASGWLFLASVSLVFLGTVLWVGSETGTAGMADVAVLLWMGAALLAAAAVLHPSSGSMGRPLPRHDLRGAASHAAVLGAAMAVPPMTLLLPNQLSAAAVRVTGMATIVLVALVVWRFTGLLNRVHLQANEDSLTGLVNRPVLIEQLDYLLEDPHAHGRTAVVFIDLDGFKDINDTMGHAAGDELLATVADRLKRSARKCDLVARVGGDEFVVVFTNVAPEVASELADRMLEAVRKPLQVAGRTMTLTASAGLAVSDNETDTADTLLHNADTVMYRSKEHGRDRVEIFDGALREETLHLRSLEHDLRGAGDRGELFIAYQPIFALSPEGEPNADRVVAVEALVRWQHPVHGPVSPATFIPLAERSGAIHAVGGWIMTQVLEDTAKWSQWLPPDRPFRAYLNLSAVQLSHPQFVGRMDAAVARTGAPPSRLGVEITETALPDDGDGARIALSKLRDRGFRVSIDDFGTGYSSLRQLQYLPVDVLKLDSSFTHGLDSGTRERAIVDAVIGLSRELGLAIVVEGVETLAQLEEMRSRGCDHAQGFLLARPMPAAELESLLGLRPIHTTLRSSNRSGDRQAAPTW